MNRKQRRELKAIEKEPLKALKESVAHYFPSLIDEMNEIKDPRDKRYTTYSMATLLGMGLLKNICGLTSMQQMTECFNTEACIVNISDFLHNENEELPHYVTLNACLNKLDPEELQRLRKKIIYKCIRSRSFENARFRKKWLMIVDATWLPVRHEKADEHCTHREFKQSDGAKKTIYYRAVLEAKIVFGEELILSLGTEFIENNAKDAERQKEMNAAEIKQDCETKAFKRLAKRLKEEFPKLPICLLGDSLYAGEPVFDICKKNHWDYIIRFKDGSIPGIAQEYEDIPEKETGSDGHSTYVQDIAYGKHTVNLLKYHESKKEEGKDVEVTFQWVTNITITKKRAIKIVNAGRKRWKIENEGFNTQKNYRYDLEHENSENWNALKNHYLLTQIADIFRQLYVLRYQTKIGLKKTEKNISSDLLQSFSRQQVVRQEDIFSVRPA